MNYGGESCGVCMGRVSLCYTPVAYLVSPVKGSGKAESLGIRKDHKGNTDAVAKMVTLDFLSEKDNQQAGQEVGEEGCSYDSSFP